MRHCPRCNVPFRSERRTFAEIDTCPACGGTFLDVGEGVIALGHRDDLQSVVDRGEAQLVGRSAMACPSGHGPLTLYRFGDPSDAVEIDICGTCGGAFFDAGETDIIAEIQRRAGEVRNSFAEPPAASRSAQDAAIEAARREGGRSAFTMFFSSLASGLAAAAASAAHDHHHHHHRRRHAVKWK